MPIESKESALPLSRMGGPASLHSPPSSAATAAASKMPTSVAAVAAVASSTQSADVMRVYADAVDKAKADSEKLMMQAKQGRYSVLTRHLYGSDVVFCMAMAAFEAIFLVN